MSINDGPFIDILQDSSGVWHLDIDADRRFAGGLHELIRIARRERPGYVARWTTWDDLLNDEVLETKYVVKDVHGCFAIEPEHHGLTLVVWSTHGEDAKTFNTREEAEAHVEQLRQLGFTNVAGVSPV